MICPHRKAPSPENDTGKQKTRPRIHAQGSSRRRRRRLQPTPMDSSIFTPYYTSTGSIVSCARGPASDATRRFRQAGPLRNVWPLGGSDGLEARFANSSAGLGREDAARRGGRKVRADRPINKSGGTRTICVIRRAESVTPCICGAKVRAMGYRTLYLCSSYARPKYMLTSNLGTSA